MGLSAFLLDMLKLLVFWYCPDCHYFRFRNLRYFFKSVSLSIPYFNFTFLFSYIYKCFSSHCCVKYSQVKKLSWVIHRVLSRAKSDPFSILSSDSNTHYRCKKWLNPSFFCKLLKKLLTLLFKKYPFLSGWKPLTRWGLNCYSVVIQW